MYLSESRVRFKCKIQGWRSTTIIRDINRQTCISRDANSCEILMTLKKNDKRPVRTFGWHIIQPYHDKTNKMVCPPSEDSDHPGHPPSLIRVLQCAQWVAEDPVFLNADSEDSDQTGRMPRLIWVFAWRKGHFVGFVMRRLICQYVVASKCDFCLTMQKALKTVSKLTLHRMGIFYSLYSQHPSWSKCFQCP